MVGGDYIKRNISLLSKDGRLILIAFLKGSKVEINFMNVMLKRLIITGSTLRPQTDYFKAKIAKELYSEVWPLFDTKRIRPIVDTIFSINRVQEAHHYMESSKHIGKIMLTFHS